MAVTKNINPDFALMGSQGTTPFKLSDILSLGDWFGNASDGKGAKRGSAVVEGVDKLGGAGMSFLMADRTGNSALQKRGKTADAVYDAVATGVQAIPGIGTALSAGMQGLQLGMKYLAKDAKKIQLGQTLGSSSSYAGLGNAVADKAADVAAFNNAGIGRLFMGGRNKMNRSVDELNAQQKSATNILQNNQKLMAAAGNNANYLNSANMLKFNNFGNSRIHVGKLGLNTSFLEEFRAQRKQVNLHREGGTILSTIEETENPVNVIVNGPLHKELNHMENVVDVDITRKGVPVLTKMEEGGEIEQAAELERDEIIFHYDLTKKLEALEKEGTDEAAIEAGKILVKEILKNTKDSKSKLLKTVV